ncbi:MAG: RAMP superfamily CRISPR-associated protein [Acidobacteriota bacterium]
MTHRLIVDLRGGLLLGGTAVAGFHDVSLRDAEGLPYIPASSLKGAIRQQMIRLAPHHEGGAALAEGLLGKPGHDPSTEAQPSEAQREDFGGGTTRVYLTNAVLVDKAHRELFTTGVGWSPRTQVSIERRGRRAADQRLFDREVLAPFLDGLRFEAQVDLSRMNEKDLALFAASVRAVFALGASRTAGLGRAEMTLEATLNESAEPAAVRRASVQDDPLDGADAVDLVLTAVDPLCLGDRMTGNFIRTKGFIRASTLRGAVITAALGHRGERRDLSSDPTFQRLFLEEETCVRFGDAWPVALVPDEEQPASDAPQVAPRTMRQCKKGHRGDGSADRDWREDTLIRSYLQVLAARHSTFLRPPDVCQLCGGRRSAAKGTLHAVEASRRVMTRVRIDPRSGRAGDGQLFSIELLERGTVFRATVTGLDAEARSYLRDAAHQGLRVGHGRGQGYGRMRLELRQPCRATPLRRRLEAFDRAVRQELETLAGGLGIEPSALHADHRHVAFTLLSAVQPSADADTAEAAFLAALGLREVEAVYSQVRTGQRGGWNAIAHRPKSLEPTLLAGSVLLVRTERTLDDLEPELTRLEARGAGAAREEGFGWLRVADPIHLQPLSVEAERASSSMDTTDGEDDAA